MRLPALERAADEKTQGLARGAPDEVAARAEEAEARQGDRRAASTPAMTAAAPPTRMARSAMQCTIAGVLGLEDGREPPGRVARRQGIEAAALRLEGDHPSAARLDDRPVVAHPRHHDRLQPDLSCRPRHGQEVGGEEPVLGDHEDDLRAPGSRRGGLTAARRENLAGRGEEVSGTDDGCSGFYRGRRSRWNIAGPALVDPEPLPCRTRNAPRRSSRSQADRRRPARGGRIRRSRYVSDEEPGIRRRKAGKGFSYAKPDGEAVEGPGHPERIRSLAIPPAYTDVWICPKPNGHIQATGRDAKGRKQYRYHPRFREVRESTKYEHMLDFARGPAGDPGQDRRAHGLARAAARKGARHGRAPPGTTLIRVGNDDYAKQNKSYGLTTLRDQHVDDRRQRAALQVQGQERQDLALKVKDRRVAKIVRRARTCPGRSCSSMSTRTASNATSPRPTSTPTCGDHRAGHHGQGFPHLGGNGAGGLGAAGIRDLRQRGQGEEEHARGHRDGRGAARQHADHLPQMLRASGGPELLCRRLAAPRGQGGDRGGTARRPRRPQAGGGGGADPARGEAQARTSRRLCRNR